MQEQINTDLERMQVFLHAMEGGSTGFLAELEKEARAQAVPIIRPGMQSLLKVILSYGKPERILEIGCAIGFSAVLMAEYTPRETLVTTIEKDTARAMQARENFARAGVSDRVTLLEGDAADILKTLEGPYQLIFMDAAKGQYPIFLEDALRLLAPGGMLVSDNVLQEGELLESHYAVQRRNRTIYKRMREYLYTLQHTEGLITTVLPVADGAALTVKTGEVRLNLQ